jgi:hypothetical protein
MNKNEDFDNIFNWKTPDPACIEKSTSFATAAAYQQSCPNKREL